MAKLSKPNIPKEIDSDVAMSVIIPSMDSIADKRLSYVYEFNGVSERTALGDDLNVNIKSKQNTISSIKFTLKRDSLYHILPEYLFHPIDRYLGTDGDTEEFEKRYKEQEEQKNKALIYFKPFDQHLQQLKITYQQYLNKNIFSGNHFFADFITDGYEINLNNPYIKAVYLCLPWLRDFRGNDDMIRVALGYAFMGNSSIDKICKESDIPMSDNVPFCLDNFLGNLYCGETYKEKKCVWNVFFQTEIETEERLHLTRTWIKEFETFFSAWFLSLDDELRVDFGDKQAIPELSDSKSIKGVFLNYSTQLI